MIKIVKKYYKEFFFRGLCSFGFGPIVLAIIYGILGLCGQVDSISYVELFFGFISVSILAFLAAAITVVYKIEELPIVSAICLHGIVLYFLYAVVYLLNGWLKNDPYTFLIFTIIFILGYAFIWGVIYFFVRKSTKKLNEKINSKK
jgi:hypothetical protein